MRDADAESAPRQLRIDDLIQQLTEFAAEHWTERQEAIR